MEIDSFDCARINMGFTRLEINFFDMPNLKPKFQNFEEELSYLESMVSDLDIKISKLVDIKILNIINLGKDTDQHLMAQNLKIALTNLPPSTLTNRMMIYEFQMEMNDKSRAIGNMLVYDYALYSKINRVQPSGKNQICLGSVTRQEFIERCPIMANRTYTRQKKKLADLIFPINLSNKKESLNIQTFLKLFPSTYTANKTHCAVLLDYWCTVFGKRDLLKNIPTENFDDIGDSFIQVLGFFKRGRT